MPAAPLKAGESAFQCCRNSGGHLSQRWLPLRHTPSRPFHTSTNSQDERGPRERILRFGRKDASPAGQAPSAGKIDMAKKFRLATTTGEDQSIQPIVLKNYEEKKHGRKRQKLVTEVGKEAQLPSTTELLRSAEGAAEHSQEDVNTEVDSIKDKVLKEDKVLRSRARRVAAKRAELQGETTRRPRGQVNLANPAPKVILQATYLRWQKQLSDMFDADQLLAYVQHYLAQHQEDPRLNHVRSADGVPHSGSQLHQGWRPLSRDFNQLLSQRSRSRKAIADRIIRWLWQYEVEEEIQSTGTMVVAVDNDISPFFVKSRHATVLPFLGASPAVSIGLRPDGCTIEIRGPKFECFEMERIIRQRIADLSVVRLDKQAFRYQAEAPKDMKRKKPKTPDDLVLPADVVEAIVQAHGCVTPKADAKTIQIIGPNPAVTEDCERALIQAIELPSPAAYSIMTGGNESEGALFLDEQAMESVPWIVRQKSSGRFVAARSIQTVVRQSDAADVDVDSLVEDLARIKDLTTAPQSNIQSLDAGPLNWSAYSEITADVGKILQPVQDDSLPKFTTGKQLATYTKKTPDFASTVQGVPQLLAVTLQNPPLRPSNHVRLTFVGEPASRLTDTGKSVPLLKVDLRREGQVVTVLAARLVRETNITDVMLPSLSFDVRFTRKNILALSNANDNLKLVDFATKVQYTDERWSSDWLLNLKIPSSALVENESRRSTKQRKALANSDDTTTQDDGNRPVNIRYVPINLERIQTISFPFRKHILDITHVNSGHFGMNVEQVRLRMATAKEQKDIFRIVQSDAPRGSSPLVRSQPSTPSDQLIADIPSDDDASPQMIANVASSTNSQENGYLEAVAHLVRRLSRGMGKLDYMNMDLSRAPKAVRQTPNL